MYLINVSKLVSILKDNSFSSISYTRINTVGKKGWLFKNTIMKISMWESGKKLSFLSSWICLKKWPFFVSWLHGVGGKTLRARVSINSYLLSFKESSSFKCKAFVVLTQTRQAKLWQGLNCFRKSKVFQRLWKKK